MSDVVEPRFLCLLTRLACHLCSAASAINLLDERRRRVMDCFCASRKVVTRRCRLAQTIPCTAGDGAHNRLPYKKSPFLVRDVNFVRGILPLSRPRLHHSRDHCDSPILSPCWTFAIVRPGCPTAFRLSTGRNVDSQSCQHARCSTFTMVRSIDMKRGTASSCCISGVL